MSMDIDLSIIVSIAAVIGTVITYVTAANKLKFEVSLMAKENERQIEDIKAQSKLLNELQNTDGNCRIETRAKIAALTETCKALENRITALEEAIKSFNRNSAGQARV